MILTLQRETLSPATIGRMSIDGVPECDTLERPWKDNRKAISCIPPGRYELAWRPSPRLKLFARQRVEGWDAWGNQVPEVVA